MRLTRTAFIILFLIGSVWADESQPGSIKTSVREALDKGLPPIGFRFDQAPGHPEMVVFPSDGVYIQSASAPPGGVYEVSLTAYHDHADNADGLRAWTENWVGTQSLKLDGAVTTGKIRLGSDQRLAAGFVTGESHARTHHLLIFIPSIRNRTQGAALRCSYGPFMAAAPNLQSFHANDGFRALLKSFEVQY